MRRIKQETKKNIIRVVMLLLAVLMILSFVLLPAAENVSAEEADVGDVIVSSFQTGKLSEAIEKAKDGTDLNLIKKIAVLEGTLDSADYAALCGYPNVEFIELAGCETKDGIIPENCMQSRNQLTYISLPKNTETIGSRAFAGNRKLLKVSIPSTLRNIGDYAFQGCEAVEEFNVPAELETLGTGAFADCKALTSFALPEAITEIPDYCFSKCSFTEMHFGPQITRVGEGAFSDCHSLTDIYFYGDTAFEANQSAFQNLKVTVHTYEDAEGFESLENNFVTIGNDLSEDSVYTPPKPSETTAATRTEAPKKTEAPETEPADETAEETQAAESKQEETDDTDSDTEAVKDDTAETEKNTEEESETTAVAVSAPEASAGTFSTAAVIIIAVLCAALAVTVTLLVVNKKK